MATISQTIFFRCIFVNEKFYILIKISLSFVPKGPIYNNPALPVWHHAIIWTDVDPIHRRIYAALGGDEELNAVLYLFQVW